MFRHILRGVVAGAAGTTAINAATYLDMAIRGRPASTAPQDTIDKLAARIGRPVPGTGDTRDNRLTGLGALGGIATGVTVGAVAGVLRAAKLPPLAGAIVIGGAAMAATDTSMARLHVSSPRTWSAGDWISDALPHLAYGAATWWVLAAWDRKRHSRT